MLNKLIYKFLRNNITKTPLFWKYRHLIDPSVWNSYKEDSKNKRRLYYIEIIETYNLKSVFEFGCASGPNYFLLKKKLNKIFYFGFDISKKAISSVNIENKSQKIMFTDDLSISIIDLYLERNKLIFFDLAIFDRVLYMISEKKLEIFMKTYSSYFTFLLIDDFHSEINCWDKEKFIYSKNYIQIMSNYNFKLIDIADSSIQSSTASEFAKRLLFKKSNSC